MSAEKIRVYPINRDYSGPAERVRLVPCRLTCDYPTKEFRLYCQHVGMISCPKLEHWLLYCEQFEFSTTATPYMNMLLLIHLRKFILLVMGC